MNPFKALAMGLDRLIAIMIKRSSELSGERLVGFMFAVRIVQAFRKGLDS